MRILVTRPVEDAGRLADALKLRGHEPVIQPLLEISFPELETLPVEGAQAVVATSRNALRGAAQCPAFADLPHLPIFCVGDATAELAREMGFGAIIAGPGTGAELVPLITANLTPAGGPLLHLAGNRMAYDLRTALEERGFTVRQPVVYRSDVVQRLGEDTVAELRAGKIDAVILMSPRTAARFAELAQQHALVDCARTLTYYCLSEEIAARLAPLQPEHLKITRRPDQNELLELLGSQNAT